MDEKSKSSIKR